ncbi:MAG: LPP20 family lipoprotein, partial [Sphaerochaetaceae bacterium]|nr:LPP20 family lipoprotein [Sphaerochaetaceae bacterium]
MFELRKFTVLLFVFSVPALLFAVPQWVSDPYCEFPQSDYICGIGSGSTLTDADNAAKTEIAGFFGTSVDSQIRSFSSYGSASDSEEIFETDSVSAIVVDDISGIRIDSRHFSNDMFYSHAVLKKSSAAMYCAEKIPALEKQLLQIQTLIKDTQGSFSAMQDCERYTKIYDKYLKNIRMVNV